MEAGRGAAAEALAATGHRPAGDVVVVPPALGVLVGGLVATRAIDSTLLQALALLSFFAGPALLVSAYRRITGLWVGGYRREPAGRATALLVSACVAAIAGAYLAVGVAAFLAAGAAIAVATVVLGRRFDETLREELRG